MTYAYTPETCPTKHYNPGDDICQDCGVYLNGPADGPEIVADGPYPDSDNEISLADAARQMEALSRDLGRTVGAMLVVYEKRPALSGEQPDVTTEAFAASLDEWTALTARLVEDWRGIAERAERAEAQARALANPEPETRRVVVLSTAHLKPETLDLLNNAPLDKWPVAGGALAYGYYVYVHDESENEHPADLEACFAWARGRFDYIQFDCDADARPDIPRYEH